VLDNGIIKTNHGDVFGESFDVFVPRLADDLKETIDKVAFKSIKLQELSDYVEELNKSKDIRIEFEKGTIESPDVNIFGDLFLGAKAKNYNSIKHGIDVAAEVLSGNVDKNKYILKLGFKDRAIGVVNPKLVDAESKSVVYDFRWL